MADRIYLLPVWLRAWHWTNAILIIVLAMTGASLHFAGPGMPVVPFNLARATHNVAGLMLAAAYAFFVIANIFSGNWWQYVPKPGGFWRKVMRQMQFYAWGIFRGRTTSLPAHTGEQVQRTAADHLLDGDVSRDAGADPDRA